MTTELAELILWFNLAELILWLNAATLAVLALIVPFAWSTIVKQARRSKPGMAWLRFQQEIAYASYAAHRLGMPEDAHRFDANTRTAQRHVIAYGELPWYCVPKAVTA